MYVITVFKLKMFIEINFIMQFIKANYRIISVNFNKNNDERIVMQFVFITRVHR